MRVTCKTTLLMVVGARRLGGPGASPTRRRTHPRTAGARRTIPTTSATRASSGSATSTSRPVAAIAKRSRPSIGAIAGGAIANRVADEHEPSRRSSASSRALSSATASAASSTKPTAAASAMRSRSRSRANASPGRTRRPVALRDVARRRPPARRHAVPRVHARDGGGPPALVDADRRRVPIAARSLASRADSQAAGHRRPARWASTAPPLPGYTPRAT